MNTRTESSGHDRTPAHHAAIDVDTPIGTLRLVADTDVDALVAIHFDASIAPHGEVLTDAMEVPDDSVLSAAMRELVEYFAGDRQEFSVQLAPVGTEFQQRAWTALSEIPFGTTRTYAEQAAALGDRRKARAVGAANGKNPIPIIVPCHRVIGADGSLTGFAGGVDTKRWLLDHERRTLGGW